MKKIILIVTILIIVANYIDAQERDQIHFGLKVGANYSNVYDIKGQDFTANYNQQVHAIEMSGIRQP